VERLVGGFDRGIGVGRAAARDQRPGVAGKRVFGRKVFARAGRDVRPVDVMVVPPELTGRLHASSASPYRPA
jgi:hypothetical protein